MSFTEWLQRNEIEAVAGRHIDQPAPVANDQPAVWPLVIMDMDVARVRDCYAPKHRF